MDLNITKNKILIESDNENSDDDYNNQYYIEEEIQNNTDEDFTISKKYYKYQSSIKIFYELLIFRLFKFNMTNIYKMDNNDYYIYVFKKEVKDFIFTIILCDSNYEVPNKEQILNNLNTNIYKNLLVFISCNGIFIKNKDNEYCFLTIDQKIKIIDKLIEVYINDINNNILKSKLCIKYLFFNYVDKIKNEIQY